MQKIYKYTYIGIFVLILGVYPSFSKPVFAATLNLPGNCSGVSSCISSMSSGDTLIIADGTYSDSISSIKANTTIQAANDGKVKFTGSFNPGNAGFTMQGIVVKSSNGKSLGSNNTYRRMSFVGGPSCGNTVNSEVGSNTKIYDSAFYGLGGRYLLLAYQQNGGIVLQNVIFRPDGGWGSGSGCNEWEPHAAYNMYDTEGFTISGAIVVDAISTASGESENLGGQVVNTHQSHGNVGTISQSAITTSGDYGRFSSDGMGSHSLSVIDSVAKGNTVGWGMSRNCSGTTTATRFDSDKLVEAWKGSINRTTGANFVLNTTFLNDPRWKQEMCTDAGVTRGFCSGSTSLGTYVANNLGISVPTPDTDPPTSPTNLAATSPSQSSISVSWTASTDNIGVTGYIVERCQSSGCSNFVQVGTPTASPFVDTGLTANTFYNYHVRAVDGAGNFSGWSNVVGATTQSTTPVPCNTVTTANFSQSAYNSYGAPFDAFQTSTNLISANCNSADTHTIQVTLGQTGDTTRIAYTKGYYYANNAWTQYTGTCTGALNGEWCQGSVSATITNPNISTASASAPAYFVGMTCSVQSGGWKCGCRDTTCSNFYWQIQGAGQ